MALWDTITEWLKKPAEITSKTQQVIAENPEQFNRLYQQATGKPYIPVTPNRVQLADQSPMKNLQLNRDILSNAPFVAPQQIKSPTALEKFRQIKQTPEWQKWMGAPNQPLTSALQINPLKQFWDASKSYYEDVLPYLVAYGSEMPQFKGETPKERMQSALDYYKNPERVREYWEAKTPKWQQEGQKLALDPLMYVGGGAGKVEQAAVLAKNALSKGIPEAKIASELASRFKFNPEQVTQVLNKAKGVAEKVASKAKRTGAVLRDELEVLRRNGLLTKVDDALVTAEMQKSIPKEQFAEYNRIINKVGVEGLLTDVSPNQMGAALDKEFEILGKKGWVYNQSERAWYKPDMRLSDAEIKGLVAEQARESAEKVVATQEKFVPTAQAKLLSLLRQAKPVRKTQESMYSAERAKRGLAGAGVLAKGEGKEAFQAAKGQLAGELPKPKFEPIETGFTGDELTSLYNDIKNSVIDPLSDVSNFYAKVNASEGLTKLLSGVVPQEKELKLLEKVFGPELITAVMGKKTKWTIAKDIFLDVANLPRAFQTAFDFSAPFRQGALLFAGHPLQGFKSMKPMFQSFYKAKYYDALNEALLQNKWAQSLLDWGLDITTIAPKARRTAMEEAYLSKYAKYIPGIKQSERAYLAFLNKMRMDVASSVLDKWSKAGVEISDELGSGLANIINVMSGRGSLGKMTYSAPFLNVLMYSPRLQAARVQLPYYYIKSLSNPKLRPVAKEMTRNIMAFMAGGLTLVGLAKFAGAKVETDPRSSDFMKIRVGNTRVDPWAGFQQYVRFLAQIIGGERKTTTTGSVVPVNRKEIAYRFLETKFAPSASLVKDLLAGQTFTGEKMELTWESLGQQAKERMLSLFVQDMWDAAEQEGLAGIGLALPAMFGVGVQSYPDTMADLEAQIGTKTEEGKVYTLSNFSGDLGRRGLIGGEEGSDLMKFRGEVETLFDKYGEIKNSASRENYRIENPKLDAALFFWGRTETLKTESAKKYVQNWIDKYEIPLSAIPEWSSYYGDVEPTKKNIARQDEIVRNTVENQVWSQYPVQLRRISDQIKKLESSDSPSDQLKARQMLMQYPQILMARKIIAQQIALYKRQREIAGVR